jgi:hypothetical protein
METNVKNDPVVAIAGVTGAVGAVIPARSSLIGHNRNSSYGCSKKVSFNGRLMFQY